MRTTTGSRPADPGLTPGQVIEELKLRGFTPGFAVRILTIASEFGIDAECTPDGQDVVTVQRVSQGRYRIVNKMVLL